MSTMNQLKVRHSYSALLEATEQEPVTFAVILRGKYPLWLIMPFENSGACLSKLKTFSFDEKHQQKAKGYGDDVKTVCHGKLCREGGNKFIYDLDGGSGGNLQTESNIFFGGMINKRPIFKKGNIDAKPFVPADDVQAHLERLEKKYAGILDRAGDPQERDVGASRRAKFDLPPVDEMSDANFAQTLLSDIDAAVAALPEEFHVSRVLTGKAAKVRDRIYNEIKDDLELLIMPDGERVPLGDNVRTVAAVCVPEDGTLKDMTVAARNNLAEIYKTPGFQKVMQLLVVRISKIGGVRIEERLTDLKREMNAPLKAIHDYVEKEHAGGEKPTIDLSRHERIVRACSGSYSSVISSIMQDDKFNPSAAQKAVERLQNLIKTLQSFADQLQDLDQAGFKTALSNDNAIVVCEGYRKRINVAKRYMIAA